MGPVVGISADDLRVVSPGAAGLDGSASKRVSRAPMTPRTGWPGAAPWRDNAATEASLSVRRLHPTPSVSRPSVAPMRPLALLLLLATLAQAPPARADA